MMTGAARLERLLSPVPQLRGDHWDTGADSWTPVWLWEQVVP